MLRRHPDVAIGNIVGSSILSILGIWDEEAVIAPILVPPKDLIYDLWVLVAVAALLIVFATTAWTLSRREGLVFVVCYAAYIALAGLRASGMV